MSERAMSEAVTVATRDGRPVDGAAGAPDRGVASRIVNRVGGGVVQIGLILVALFWLIPTLGLFVASLRSETDNADSGWWKIFTAPSQLTFGNYSSLLKNDTITSSFVNTILITVPT